MQIACHIQDDATFKRIESALSSAGFECKRFDSDTNLVYVVHNGAYQLVLLDADDIISHRQVLGPWLQCCATKRVSVIVVGKDGDTRTVIHALEAGADDVVSDAFEPRELVARVRAVVRRYLPVAADVIEVQGFRIDQSTSSVYDRGVPVALTAKEFDLVWLLFSFAGKSLSRAKISLAVWGRGVETSERTIEQHLHKLRKKLQLSKERGVWLQTIYNEGVCLHLHNSEKTATPLAAGCFDDTHAGYLAPMHAGAGTAVSH